MQNTSFWSGKNATCVCKALPSQKQFPVPWTKQRASKVALSATFEKKTDSVITLESARLPSSQKNKSFPFCCGGEPTYDSDYVDDVVGDLPNLPKKKSSDPRTRLPRISKMLEMGYEEDEIEQILDDIETKGKKFYFAGDDELEEEFSPIPAVNVSRTYECNCFGHSNDHEENVERIRPTFAQVVGNEFAAEGKGLLIGSKFGIVENLLLPRGEVRNVNSIIGRPTFYQYVELKVEQKCSNDNLPAEIEKKCSNMSIGWMENQVWVYEDGLVRKGHGVPCKCGGYSVTKGAVLDSPCWCGMKGYHNANVVAKTDEVQVIVNSPGYRLAGNKEWQFDVSPGKCGFRGRTRVMSMSKDSWVIQAVAIYGTSSFSFTPQAFEVLVQMLPVYAARVGGINTNVAMQVAEMMIGCPNARVLLAKMIKPRKIKSEDVVLEAGLVHEFEPMKARMKVLTITEWTKREVPKYVSLEVVYPTPAVSAYKCDVCNIGVNTLAMLKVHEAGKRHQRALKFVPSEFCCKLCRINVPLQQHLDMHLAGYEHYKRIVEFDAQGLVTDAALLVGCATGVVNSLAESITKMEMLDQLYHLYGGEGVMPIDDRRYLIATLFHLARMDTMAVIEQAFTNVAFPRVSSKTLKFAKYVIVAMGLFIVLRKITQSTPEYEAQGIPSNVYESVKLLLPGLVTEDNKKTIVDDLRASALARNTLKDYWQFAKFLYEWVVSLIHQYVVETPDELRQWLDMVDAIEEVELKDDSSSTLRVHLAKSQEYRRKIYQLQKQGKALRKQIEVVGKNTFFLKMVNDRMKRMDTILAKNSGTFVGSQRKFKPHVIYLYGAPKTGKSVMIDHLYSDIFEVLGEEPYVPGMDRHTINPLDEFHDSYQYNRLVDIQDLFQLKNEDARTNELHSLIHMADETPYALKIAECSGKGAVFFCSEHLAFTSNFDLATRKRCVESITESYDAVFRRIDIYAEVMRDTSQNPPHFDRDLMSFNVGKQTKTHMNWYEFVACCAANIIRNRERSEGVNSMVKDEAVNDKLKMVKLKVGELKRGVLPLPEFAVQGKYADCKKTCHEKIASIIEAMKYSRRERFGVHAYSFLAGFGLASFWRANFMRGMMWVCDTIATTVGGICDFAIDWFGVLALSATVVGALVAFGKSRNVFPAEAAPYPAHRALEERKKRGKYYQESAPYPQHVQYEQRKERRKYYQEARPLKELVAEGSVSPNLRSTRQVCSRNLGRVVGKSMMTQCFGLFGHVVAVPLHVIDDLDNDELRFSLFSVVHITVPLKEVEKKYVLEHHHMVLLDLHPWLENYTPFTDITRRVWNGTEQVCDDGMLITSRAAANGASEYWGIALTNIKVMGTSAYIRKPDGKRYVFTKGMTAYGCSEVGDCGGPWIMETPIAALIVGIHVGGTPKREVSAGYLDKTLLAQFKEYFAVVDNVPVEYVANGTIYDVDIEESNTVEVCGDTDVMVYQPRKTKIVPSIFSGLIPARTAPAVLKSKLIQMEDGRFERIHPLVVNFMKNKISKKNIPMELIAAGQELLDDWYFPHGKKKGERRVLTIEEAVFGDPEDTRNGSINPKSGVGWPWLNTYSRKQLIDLEKHVIHDALREACGDLMNDVKNSAILMVDMLKDERLPLEKVENVRTRVFTILPIHVNIVLKQLFGHFVMYVMEKHNVCPVKLGISQVPEEWTELYNFLDNGGLYVAGDYSAFDKGMHYELMMSIVDMANRFYDDGFSTIRNQLVEKVFSAYHLVDGVVYKTFGGMPSGCYLTAAFNSLVNVLYWYVYLVEMRVEDLKYHRDWFRPAVFGDDHVIAVLGHPQVNQISFSQWLKGYGLKYTSATKKDVELEYTPFEEVSFLKRSFRKEGVRWWAPLELEVVLDSAQWFHKSEVTNAMSQKDLAVAILGQTELELVQHGKKVFDEWQGKMIEMLPFDVSDSVRRFETVKKVFLRQATLQLQSNMNVSQENFNLHQIAENSCEFGFCDAISFNAQGIELDQPQEVETVLGTATVENSVQGLTHFTEQIASSIAPATADLCVAIDDMFELPTDFFKMCYRWLKINRFSIGKGVPGLGPVLRIDPLNYLVEDPFIRDKISSTTFVRYTMEVQLKLVATKFHYGAFVVVWRPYYAAGQTALCYFSLKQRDDDVEDVLFCSTPPVTAARFSPYDTVHTASQLESTILSVTVKNTVKVRVPWCVPYQYVPTAKMTDPRYHPGFLDVYKITPTGPENIDDPEFVIFAAFTNIRGWGYKSEDNPPRRLRYLAGPASNAPFDQDYSTWSVPVPVFPSAFMDPVDWVPFSATNAVAVFDAQGDVVQESKEQSTGSWLLDAAFWVLDKSRTVLTMFTPLGPLLGFFGLSRPLDPTPLNRMIISSVPLSNALGVDHSYSTAMNPCALLEQDSSPQDKLITTLASHPTYLGYFSFEPTSMAKRAYSVSPMHVKPVGAMFCGTPASYIVSHFRYWRSNIKWNLRFFSSSFVSMRVAVYITYNDVGGKIGLVPTRVVDVNGDVECDIDLPFMHQAPWYDTASGFDYANMYNITIEPITDVVSDEATDAKPVYCAVWVSFPGLQVAGPSAKQFSTTSYTYMPAMTYDAQGVEMPGLGTADQRVNVKWGMNDIPASIYHLVKRYQPTYARKLRPWILPQTKGKIAAGGKVYYLNDAPTYQYYALLFRFYRCSINLFSKGTGLTENIIPYGEKFRDGPSLRDFSYTDASMIASMGIVNARLPMRMNVSYLPSPMFGFSTSFTVVYNPTTHAMTSFKIDKVAWSNSLETSEYGDKIGTTGVVSLDAKDPFFFASAADDFSVHTFVGVPLFMPVNLDNWLAYRNK